MLLECLLYGEYMTGRVFNCKCVVVFAPKKFCAIDVWLLSGVEAEDVAEGVIGFDDVVVSIDEDRKSTRLNSSHSQISYAVLCLKKKEPPLVLSDAGRLHS